MDIAALDQHAMIQITDLQARIIEVNDCLLSATGFSNSDLIGQSASSLYHDRDRPMAFEIRDKILAGLAWTGEMRLMRKDGSVMWTQATIVPRRDSEGALVGAISIRSDISESKFADHHNDLTTTLHKLSDEVYMIDSDTFSFTYMNEAAMRRAKTNESGYDNWNLRKLFSDQEFDGFVQRIAPLLDGKTANNMAIALSRFITMLFCSTFPTNCGFSYTRRPPGNASSSPFFATKPNRPRLSASARNCSPRSAMSCVRR